MQLVQDLRHPRPELVLRAGEIVWDHGSYLLHTAPYQIPDHLRSSVHLRPVTEADFAVKVPVRPGFSGGTAVVTHITVWTYYNGDQLESFNKLVDQFNETTGREKGIRVESASQGSMSDLETNVMDAAQGKAPAAEPAASVPAASEPETPQENSLLPADEPQKDAAPAAESTAPAADTGKGELHETV